MILFIQELITMSNKEEHQPKRLQTAAAWTVHTWPHLRDQKWKGNATSVLTHTPAPAGTPTALLPADSSFPNIISLSRPLSPLHYLLFLHSPHAIQGSGEKTQTERGRQPGESGSAREGAGLYRGEVGGGLGAKREAPVASCLLP